MRHILFPLIVIALILSGCSGGKVDPERDYYALNQIYVASLNVADDFVQNCVKQPASHPCRAGIPPIKAAVGITRKAFLEADKVFVTKDSPYYNLALSAAQNALNDLLALVKKFKAPPAPVPVSSLSGLS